VELTFQPVDGGTEAGLEHRNLERFRKQTATWTAAVAEGWRRKPDDLPPSQICPTRRNEGRPGPILRTAFNPIAASLGRERSRAPALARHH
jgi:hypothetical protein